MQRLINRLSRGLIVAFLLILTLLGSRLSLAASTGKTYHLTPSDSIQAALNQAQPGDTLVLSAGTYTQSLVSVRDGRPDAPITITGPREAVLNGHDNGRLIEINHAYIVLNGFTVDGARGSAHSEKLIYVLNKRAGTPLLGLKITNMAIRNAGGECIRLRYLVQRAEIAGNSVGPCGLDDFPGGTWAGGSKNGEGLYIGTAPEQQADGKNPDSRPDESSNNWIHHNSFNTRGNECVDIKEHSSSNVVEYNDCTGQRDPESAGLDARGSGNILRMNRSYNNLGAGVRLGGDSASDGTANDVYGNELFGNGAGGFKIMRDGQGLLCGNTGAQANVTGGTYGGRYQPGAACLSGDTAPPPTAAPTAPPPTAAPTAAPTAPPPTAAPTAAPTAPPPASPAQAAGLQIRAGVRSEVEAEHGDLGGWELKQDANRQGGAYIRNSGPGGVHSVSMVASYRFEKLDGGSSCRLQVLGRGKGSDANSVRVRVDDQGWVIVHLKEGGWKWVDAEKKLSIANGQHRLEIANREYGSSVDAWALTCP